ncbi:MAG: hypothetical protein CM15mL4_3050 [uncultured marine virus]|nr:MAG: hypothetical protein CM15mL4_3050 [uncultured marine virus]
MDGLVIIVYSAELGMDYTEAKRIVDNGEPGFDG